MQQRLTPRGARLLRSQIKATGRFRPDRLPATAWADRTIRPYIPTHYKISHDHGVGPKPSRMPAPAGAALAHFAAFLRTSDQVITLSQAIALTHAFLKAGITPFFHLPGDFLAYNDLNGDPRGSDSGLVMGPMLPGTNCPAGRV